MRRTGSQSSRVSQQHAIGATDVAEDARSSTSAAPADRVYATPSIAVSSSGNQKTPARSFFHRSHNKLSAPPDSSRDPAERVREQTAELASYALSDAASSIYSGSPTARHHAFSDLDAGADPCFGRASEDDEAAMRASVHEDMIEEVSEPATPIGDRPPTRHSPGTSVLTQLLRHSPPEHEQIDGGGAVNGQSVTGRSSTTAIGLEDPSVPAPTERTSLLPKGPSHERQPSPRRGLHDIEGQVRSRGKPWLMSRIRTWPEEKLFPLARAATNPKTWNRRILWRSGIVRPVSYVPAVILGLLLNVLDALSYGMILFPLGQPIFSKLGPDGISMFYVSCIISQLVFSCGGSAFKGGIGSEMIEVVPFFHQMAFTILAEVGEDRPKTVIATTILAYAASSVLTGIVFFAMGACKLGSLIGFFPRHILIGCIGGVGWFLLATGIEVSARLDNNLEYNLLTLRKLFTFDTVFLWTTPLLLAIVLMTSQRWVKQPIYVPCFFLAIPAVFYFFVAAIPNLQLDELRDRGWVFGMPEAGEPFYHFYTLYDFFAVDWKAFASTIPAMFALTFFGVLHVPINVPALGFSTGDDNVDVDRELIAHGISNALSGFAGSIQNYLVYTNSLLFIRSGGDSRLAGIMLALATFGIMTVGPTLIGYIPIMVVGALIFLLGIDLLREALYDTWGKVHRLEYLTIIAIVVTMGAWDFVIGILVGIVLACVSYVVQTSRVSAVRVTYTGEIASSTVRRHAVQRRFLREVGQQIHVTKLAGFLFFGTIVSVEKRTRALLEEDAFQARPIRFLIVDLHHVTGIDFSAAEAFTRIKRVLAVKNVSMVVCGVAMDDELGQSLRSVGFWNEENDVQIFADLNSALEFCENQLLKTFYTRRDALVLRHAQPHLLGTFLATCSGQADRAGGRAVGAPDFAFDTSFGSPRRHQLQHVATTALSEQAAAIPSRWQNFKQPLPLLLQTFQDLTEQNEDFWFRACPYFRRLEHPAGTVLYRRGDRPNGFYLLEDGILRAEYDLPQGAYHESIVAGTTCGELPFFSETSRTATVAAERDCVAWLLDEQRWDELQAEEAEVAQELLRIGLKLTSERMSAITS
ncbi:MAG: hypothetical protein M1832_004904 [Thelocarpon impressellum]|nr:MAG: hypothetical protein M1832_004904 [Thelocarpon impressellum]